jgi:hypothetical protein
MTNRSIVNSELIIWVVGGLIAIGIYVGASSHFITEVQAMIVAERIVERDSYPKSSGLILEQKFLTIEESLARLEKNDEKLELYQMYFAGIIEKEKLLDKLGKVEKGFKNSLKHNQMVSKYLKP